MIIHTISIFRNLISIILFFALDNNSTTKRTTLLASSQTIRWDLNACQNGSPWTFAHSDSFANSLLQSELLLQVALEIPQDKNPRRLAEFNKCVFLILTEY
jgi:hypothetical protein